MSVVWSVGRSIRSYSRCDQPNDRTSSTSDPPLLHLSSAASSRFSLHLRRRHTEPSRRPVVRPAGRPAGYSTVAGVAIRMMQSATVPLDTISFRVRSVRSTSSRYCLVPPRPCRVPVRPRRDLPRPAALVPISWGPGVQTTTHLPLPAAALRHKRTIQTVGCRSVRACVRVCECVCVCV